MKNNWISVNKKLPTPGELVWMTDGDFVWLGAYINIDGLGYIWVRSDGIFQVEYDNIVSDCEADDDYKIKFWHKLPKFKLPEVDNES